MSLESYSRKNNLKFLNVKQNTAGSKKQAEDCEELILRMCCKHGIEMESRYIERAHRLGYKGKVNGPIIVKFNNYKDKQRVLKEKKRFRSDGVIIIEDFPSETQKQRKIFAPAIGAAYKSNGNYKATLVGEKLLLNGKFYGTNEVEGLPEDLRPIS